MLSCLTFVFLALSLLSVWVKREPKFWGGLLWLSVLCAMISGFLFPTGLGFLVGWMLLWLGYKHQAPSARSIWFALIVFLSFGFKLHLFPGFQPLHVGSLFYLGLDSPIVGLFPLALFVAVAQNAKEWREAFSAKGLLLTILGIAVLALIATSTGTVLPEVKWPTFPLLRYLSNLILFTIPEEAFYRGFVLYELCRYFGNSKKGNIYALVLSSLLYMLAHVYWSPNTPILAFVFVTGLLYGGVYLISRRIESSIFCHFLLNFCHMTFFTYHAM